MLGTPQDVTNQAKKVYYTLQLQRNNTAIGLSAHRSCPMCALSPLSLFFTGPTHGCNIRKRTVSFFSLHYLTCRWSKAYTRNPSLRRHSPSFRSLRIFFRHILISSLHVSSRLGRCKDPGGRRGLLPAEHCMEASVSYCTACAVVFLPLCVLIGPTLCCRLVGRGYLLLGGWSTRTDFCGSAERRPTEQVPGA